MASNEALQRHQIPTEHLKDPGMIEKQRLELEKDLATARRAIHRAIATAERGAYYGLEDELHIVNARLSALMDAVMQGRDYVRTPV